MKDDRDIAELLSAVAEQYKTMLEEGARPIHRTRLEIIRKLGLIEQSIKGLMKTDQKELGI